MATAHQIQATTCNTAISWSPVTVSIPNRFANFVKQISWQKRHQATFRSRCVVDNLRNQIKFSFIYQSSDFIGRPFVLCDLFELSGSNTSGSDEPKECRVFLCPSVVLTESYPTRFTYQSLEVILVHIWWPLNRCFVLSCDLWEWGKQIFIFISYFILVYHIRNIR